MPHANRRGDRIRATAYVAAGLMACAGLGVSGATIALLLGVFHE